jgi:hypothetical protein
MQFSPNVWGPFFWHTIHIIALGYPDKPTYTDKKCAKEFYESFAHMLPCGICRKHYIEYLAVHPITPYLDSRKDLLKWTIQLHNNVNKLLKKSEWLESDMIEYYERIGRIDRSPVWTKDDMKIVDYRSFIKGFVTGSIVLSGVAGIVYIINRY